MTATAEKEQKNTLPVKYKVVADLLREGKAKAITSTDIMKLAGIDSKRDVMEIIEQLITRYGYCIGTSRKGKYKGYYIISTKGELIETSHTYEMQINSMLKRHRQLQKNWSSKDQLHLEM